MKKFLLKNLFFLIPIIIMSIFTLGFYSTNKGELLRIGYIVDFFPHYLDLFKKEFNGKIYYDSISNYNSNTKKKYVVLTLGDSFSDQGCYGYKNYLAQNDSITLLHFDSFLQKNQRSQIQILYGLLNGDFFDKIRVKYVILESVERYFAVSTNNIDTNKVITLKDLVDLAKNKDSTKKTSWQDKIPTNRIIKFPFYNFLYLIKKNSCISDVYRVKIDSNLFSNNEKELLFYKDDIKFLDLNNEINNVTKLNNVLNDLSDKLQQKGIKLIVLPAPDKYDLYYEHISDKVKFKKPLFFEHMEKMSKKYVYVHSKQILKNALKKKKDIYFYDGTHWSPWGSRLIASELKEIITKDLSNINQSLANQTNAFGEKPKNK